MPFAEWQRIGRQISIISDASGWWLGDWLVFGETRYADRYRRAVAETSLDYQTLRNYAWVARKFTLGRRRAKLSLQHHAEVAALPRGEQDIWLDRAERFTWSKAELRRQLKQRGNGSRAKPAVDAVVRLAVTGDRQQRWEAAASLANVGLIDWMTEVLDRAARVQDSLHDLPYGRGDGILESQPRSAQPA